MRLSQFICDRCGAAVSLKVANADAVPDDWLALARLDCDEGTLDPIYHLCAGCAEQFTVWMDPPADARSP